MKPRCRVLPATFRATSPFSCPLSAAGGGAGDAQSGRCVRRAGFTGRVDDVALADAILTVLSTPPVRGRLRARSALFTIDAVAEQYLQVLLGSAGRGDGGQVDFAGLRRG